MTNKYIDLSEDSLNLYLKDVRKNEFNKYFISQNRSFKTIDNALSN